MPLEEIFQQQVLTEVVRRNIETEAQQNTGGESRAFYGANIAPLVPVQSRVTRIRITDVSPFGLGQFKAPDASPPLFKAAPKLSEQYIELVLLEEMERFTGEEWILLNSNDDSISRGARLSLVQRMRYMQQRNDQLTEFMRWSAFKGTVTVTYPDGGTITVDYGFSGSQLPSAGVAWTDVVNSNPVEDLYAWSQVGADAVGRYYSIVHLNSQTWRLVSRNQNIRSYLSALGRSILLPTTDDLAALMRQGTGNFQIIDSGYLAENATNRRLTKFLPDNRVLVTTEYTLDGQRIADMADGQVLVGGDTGSAPDIRQGMQSEIIANPYTKNIFRRQASARIPRLYFPQAFLYATVGA